MSRIGPRKGGQRERAGDRGAAAVLHSPTQKMFSALETAYVHFNERLFEKELPAALLNLSRSAGSSKNSVTLGFFEPEAWRGDVGNICELSMTPISTARGPEDYYATLVHEWATMERIGLPPLPGGKNGTSKIKVHHQIKADGAYAGAFKALPPDALLPFVSTEAGLLVPGPGGEGEEGEGEGTETKQGKRARYECSGGCGTTMRGPSGRNLICGNCEAPYVETGF